MLLHRVFYAPCNIIVTLDIVYYKSLFEVFCAYFVVLTSQLKTNYEQELIL